MLRLLRLHFVLLLTVALPDLSLAEQTVEDVKMQTVAEYLSGMTVRFASTDLGAGAQYFAPDGTTFLWFSGQMKIAKGRWVDQSISILKPAVSGSKPVALTSNLVCLRFQAAPRSNPTAKRFGPNECFRLDEIKDATLEMAAGDVLRLSSGKLPCRICRSEMTFNQLQKGSGG